MSKTIARIGVVTVSDRASRGEYEDLGGPAIQRYLHNVLTSPFEPLTRVVPDEQAILEQRLIELCDVEDCCLVITTGSTGPALRDIAPEATAAVCERLLPGFGELMRKVKTFTEKSKYQAPAVFINAWNEWTEGGAILPGTSYGDGYLKEIKAVYPPEK